MYNFEQHLLEDEKILWQGQAVPGKGDKSVGGELFVILGMFLMQVLLIWSVVAKVGEGANGITGKFILFFVLTLLFDGLCIHSILYKKIFGKHCVKDDYYCLTNKRAFKYELKKDELIYGYLINYEDIKCEFVKGGYGDLYMAVMIKKSVDGKDEVYSLLDAFTNKDKKNMYFMRFESIEKPSEVKRLAQEARKVLIQNNEHPTINNIEIRY